MAPLRGWALRGMRLTAKVPHGRWKTTTFLAALRHNRLDVPWVLEGSIDGESFQTYVERVLLPTLKPGDIVIMDNLGSHKGKAVRQLIRSAGAKLIFLPKYSPDPQPYRPGFCQTQAPVAKGRCAHRRSRLRGGRPIAPSLHTRGMHQLLQKCRIRSLPRPPPLFSRQRGGAGAGGKGARGFTKSCRSPEQHFRPRLELTHKFDDRSI